MGDLSANFSKYELECPCCKVLILAPALLSALEELRSLLDVPLYPNSGYRCPEHNEAVGGSPTSQHLQGKAVDIPTPGGWSPSSAANIAEMVPAFGKRGGIGIYGWGIHVDVRGWRARWRV